MSLTHWDGAPRGKCALKDDGHGSLAHHTKLVTCNVCLWAAGKRNRNHNYAVFDGDRFISSHVTRAGALESPGWLLQFPALLPDKPRHIRYWSRKDKKWVPTEGE